LRFGDAKIVEQATDLVLLLPVDPRTDCPHDPTDRREHTSAAPGAYYVARSRDDPGGQLFPKHRSTYPNPRSTRQCRQHRRREPPGPRCR